ncbi:MULTISPECIES: hypothetical protein [unclassified Streptomyces]|uniref:hypothetical protein n=1 Tax=unclassified Streptomyces TaxID=2593676 RepID=UPI000366F18F|nr:MULTISPECIES: hypothetical protein [unclassified Streptomyces]MYT33684.1 hypothetical protein [Streptomyces sp. SID8354]
MAARTATPLVLARKPGKLPGSLHTAPYALEYGNDRLKLQKGAALPGERVLYVDEVPATGGTLDDAAQLVAESAAHVAGLAVVVELSGLGGAERLSVHRLLTLCEVGP